MCVRNATRRSRGVTRRGRINQVITLLYVRSCGGARLTDGGHATYHASPHMSGQARTRMRTTMNYAGTAYSSSGSSFFSARLTADSAVCVCVTLRHYAFFYCRKNMTAFLLYSTTTPVWPLLRESGHRKDHGLLTPHSSHYRRCRAQPLNKIMPNNN